MKCNPTSISSGPSGLNDSAGAASRRHNRKSSYTLVEVFVSLAIAAIGIIAAFQFAEMQIHTYSNRPAHYKIQVAAILGTNADWKTVDVVWSASSNFTWIDPEGIRPGEKYYRVIVPTPEIFSVEPSIVQTNGGQIYILGQLFETNFTVRIGGVTISNVIFETSGRLRVTTPTLPPGTYDVEILEGNQVVTKLAMSLQTTSGSTIQVNLPPEIPPAIPRNLYVTAYNQFGNEGDYSARAQIDGTSLGLVEGAGYRISANVQDNADVGDPYTSYSSGEARVFASISVSAKAWDFCNPITYRSRLVTNTAQGNGWDFACNIFVKTQSTAIVTVFDGNARSYDLHDQGGGVFAANGLFREGKFGTNNDFTLTFADKGRWEFNPFDGSPQAGKIKRSVDRNENAFSFEYDGLGRLIRVIDALNRTNLFSYNSSNLIQSVTDFSGRIVKYSYYTNGEPGGMAGDLKSVTSPVVTNTPNGNDFPTGKTVTYTYSTGFTDDRLNHNLLTVTDAKGQTWLQNFYATNQNPDDLLFDRVISQLHGYSSNLIEFSYIPQTPSPSNGYATLRTIVNDRVGNVSEYFYDSQNRLVTLRAFTGRATVGVTTTDTQNRPTNPLRTNDAPYFETRFEWNNDFLPTRIVYPNGNSREFVYESDFDSATQPRLRANLRVHRRLPGPLGGDQPVLTEQFEHEPGFGSYGQIQVIKPDNVFDEQLSLRATGPIDEGLWKFFVAAESHSDGFYKRHEDFTFSAPPPVFGLQLLGGDKLIGTYQGRMRIKASASLENYDFPGRYAQRFDGVERGGESCDDDCNPSLYSRRGDGGEAGGADKILWPAAVLCTVARDTRGNATTYSYDARGNCTNIVHRVPTSADSFEYNSFGQITAHVWPDNGSNHRRRDEFSYYAGGPQNGYLQQSVRDAGGFNITNKFGYDTVGNLTTWVDPSDDQTLWTFNALNQIVQRVSREVTDGSGVRYTNNYFYDANDKLIRVDVQDKDENGNVRPNSPLTTTFTYDILNRLTAVTNEVSGSQTVARRFEYDANGNLSLVRFGNAVSGADTNNVVQYLYDERDLPFRGIRAPGTAIQSSWQCDLDGDGFQRRLTVGLEGVPHVLDYAYDGFNRLVGTTNSMGNVTTYHYDANGNVISRRMDGELVDLPGSASNVRLLETGFQYDAMNRLIRSEHAFFDPATQLLLPRRYAWTNGYNGCSQLAHATAVCIDDTSSPNFSDLDVAYDSANRIRTVTDAKGNIVTYVYDLNGNLTSQTNVDKSDLGNPDKILVTTFAYDNLNRLTNSTDNANNSTRFAYDSRGLQSLVTDGNGNMTRYVYDGIGRLISAIRDMNTNGPNAMESNDIVTTYTYDDSSHRTSVTDDNGHTTMFAYDSFGRLVSNNHADNTTNKMVYDVFGNVIQRMDANGTIITSQYDLLNRVTNKTITRAAGVLGTTNEMFQYDGVSRIVRAQDDDSVISRAYDSLSHLVTETTQLLPGGTVRTNSMTYDGLGNLLTEIYPGGRTITNTYDALKRIKTVSDSSGIIVSNNYIGSLGIHYDDPNNDGWYSRINLPFAPDNASWPARIERRDFGNGTRMDISYDPIYRVASLAYSRSNSVFDQRQYQYDGAHNKTFAQEPAGAHFYGYDAANRLVQSTFTNGTEAYTFDGVGNRVQVTGPIDPGIYFMSSNSPPADFQVNQYTTTPFDSNRQYDNDGNLKQQQQISGQRQFSFDYRNQLVSFASFGATNINASYKYDCFGRRLEKNVNGSITRFCYAGVSVIEEQNATNGTIATYLLDVEENGAVDGWKEFYYNMQRNGTNYFLHSDDLGNIMKVTDGSGAIVEQYQYADYGMPSFFSGSGGSISSSAIGNPYLFHGMRFEPESALYVTVKISPESMSWDPRAGRLISPAGGGLNRFNFAGNNPASADNNFAASGGMMFFGLWDDLKRFVQEVEEALDPYPRVPLPFDPKLLGSNKLIPVAPNPHEGEFLPTLPFPGGMPWTPKGVKGWEDPNDLPDNMREPR